MQIWVSTKLLSRIYRRTSLAFILIYYRKGVHTSKLLVSHFNYVESGLDVLECFWINIFWVSIATDYDNQSFLHWVFTFDWIHVSSVCNHVKMSCLKVCTCVFIHQEKLAVWMNGLKGLIVVVPRTRIPSVQVSEASCLPSIWTIRPEPEVAALTGQYLWPESKTGRESLNRQVLFRARFVSEIGGKILFDSLIANKKLWKVLNNFCELFSIK